MKAGLDEGAIAERFPRQGEVPFSSERKLMSTAHADKQQEGRRVLVSKGAPDVLLMRCARERQGAEERPLTEERRREIVGDVERLGDEALRPLGLAYRIVSRDEAPATWGPEHETRPRVAGGRGHDRSPAAGGRGRGRGRPERRHPHPHDHGRPPEDRGGHRDGAGPRSRGLGRARRAGSSRPWTRPRCARPPRARVSTRASAPSTSCASSSPCRRTGRSWP